MQKSNNNFFKRLFFFILLIVLTPVLIIEGIVSAVKKSKRKKEWKKFELEGQQLLLTKGITDIDLMEGYMFEDYLRILLFYLGFKVSQTQKSRDYGADLILIDPQTNKKIIVQAKRYSKPVGSKAVQEIATAQIHYKNLLLLINHSATVTALDNFALFKPIYFYRGQFHIASPASVATNFVNYGVHLICITLF